MIHRALFAYRSALCAREVQREGWNTDLIAEWDARTEAAGFPVLNRRIRRPWGTTPDTAALSPIRKAPGPDQIG